MNQRTFFPTFEAQLLTPTDPNARPEDVPRLTGQNATVLAMLKAGPASNMDFIRAGILRYSARICDLRQRGYKIVTEMGEGGVNTYRLEA